MNPFLILLILIVAVVLWFLLAFLYQPIGKLVSRIINDSLQEINQKDERNKEDD